MDEEASFANLLSQSAAPSNPSWNLPTSPNDPWANPFSDSPATSSSNPFATDTSAFDAASTYGIGASALDPKSPQEEVSPYVQKLEQDVDEGRGTLPDPPSVIAAREAEAAGVSEYDERAPYEAPRALEDDPFAQPFADRQREATPPFALDPPSLRIPSPTSLPPSKPSKKALPSDLIDEDLLAASDPSLALKKAFVRSESAARPVSAANGDGGKPKAYVFTPAGRRGSGSGKTNKSEVKAEVKAEKPKAETLQAETLQAVTLQAETLQAETLQAETPEAQTPTVAKIEGTEAEDDAAGKVQVDGENDKTSPIEGDDVIDSAASKSLMAQTPTTSDKVAPPHLVPASVPLPISTTATPITSRPETPVPPLKDLQSAPSSTVEQQASPADDAVTPSTDRVAVSPLEASGVSASIQNGLRDLSIGPSSSSTVAPRSPAKEGGDGWLSPPVSAKVTSPPSSRFSGKGWAAVGEEENGGLFGRGGPALKADSWGGDATDSGWGEPGISVIPSDAGPSRSIPILAESVSSPSPSEPELPMSSANGVNAENKTKPKPLFHISVGDPAKVGDPVRGYTVYTVRTRTSSPHYRKSEMTVLRRFSDFLWLFDILTMNNPGVVVPPMPNKNPFGRFQDQFIETRRQALQRCLVKITSHPVLKLDPDLRLFLESDTFSVDVKLRRAETPADKTGLLSTWTGPKYTEQDDWFDSRRSFLDSLESQLKALAKSIEIASKSRLDLALSMGDLADSMTTLADSDLGSALCAALARLADLLRREKEANEEQAKSEVMYLLNMADEYVRFISSVRLAFASRVKSYQAWQGMEKDVVRLRQTREKARQQGRLGDRVNQSLAEIGDAERRSRDASNDFEMISRLVKSEFARFERERVDEFKRVLEGYLAGQIGRQKELIEAWEEYHGIVLKMVQKTPGQGAGQGAAVQGNGR